LDYSTFKTDMHAGSVTIIEQIESGDGREVFIRAVTFNRHTDREYELLSLIPESGYLSSSARAGIRRQMGISSHHMANLILSLKKKDVLQPVLGSRGDYAAPISAMPAVDQVVLKFKRN
jgi:hypothetical protein